MNKKINSYKDLIGLFINQIKEDDNYIYFVTNKNYSIRIDKFIPYCCCYVGEYIDEITYDGTCCGIITNIEKDIIGDYKNWFDSEKEIVYKGNITFYFENGKINISVHGEDNGYYGVSFTMPCEVLYE